MTKKATLFSVSEQTGKAKKPHPRMVRTGDCSAISMIASMISSSSKNGRPPSVDPMFPCNQHLYAVTRRCRINAPTPIEHSLRSS